MHSLKLREIRPNVLVLMLLLALIIFTQPAIADTALGVLAGLSLKLMED